MSIEIGDHLYVIKRDGTREKVIFEEITKRIEQCCDINPALEKDVDPTAVAKRVVEGIHPGVKTTELDELASETAAYMSTKHVDYGILAARLSISNLHKQTSDSFLKTMELEYNNIEKKTQMKAPLLAKDVFDIIQKNHERIQAAIDYNRDFDFDFFGFKTMERGYLVKINGVTIERPQHMWMRVAIGIHKNDLEAAIDTYNCLSQKYFIHATPTLFNSGTPNPQMSSCFLLTMKSDSIEGIYDTLKQCALISKSAGGIGISISNIRASQSYIKGTNGHSNGLVPMLRVFNDTARYVDQGGGKRKGAFAVYLEPWHADIFEFLQLKKNTGKEELRARDLFYALWIPDLFMERVNVAGDWSLFCPNEAKGLCEVWGKEFEELYEKYENTPGLVKRVVKAQDLWFSILECQIETGTPYMLYKDTCNKKSNQKNLGTIKSSNLCTEIVQYTSADEVAVCNLASISLPRYVVVDDDTGDVEKLKRLERINKFIVIDLEKGKIIYFDFIQLGIMVEKMVFNLNTIIDGNLYPIEEAKRSNMRHRPMSIGIQGLADVFQKMRLPFESERAKLLNKCIHEMIYYSALNKSMEMAKMRGKPYDSYEGSPISKGVFQFEMWGLEIGKLENKLCDWNKLKKNIMENGVLNSLLVGPMPTASTSQILGNNEAFEPYTSNIYVRRVLAGEFTIVNKLLVKDLIEKGLWNEELKNEIIANNGSIQNINSIPLDLKAIYKTVWEIPQKTLIDMAVDRGAFIDQSQSFNVFMDKPSYSKLTSMHFYGWKKGLKTGMYYLRTKPAVDAIKFTIEPIVKTTEIPHLPASTTSIIATETKKRKLEPSATTQEELDEVKAKAAKINKTESFDLDTSTTPILNNDDDNEEEKQTKKNNQNSDSTVVVSNNYCKKEDGCDTCSA